MDIKALKGIGDKTAALLAKLDVNSVEDLVEFFPRAYKIYNKPVSIRQACESEDEQALFLCINGQPKIVNSRKVQIFSFPAKDESGVSITLTWFNMPFIKSIMKPGVKYIFKGKIIQKGSNLVMEQPEYHSVGDYNLLLGKMHPIYPLTKGLSNKVIEKAVNQALIEIQNKPDCFDDEFLTKNNLLDYKAARRKMHFPASEDDYREARKRFVFQEFFMFILAVGKFKTAIKNIKNDKYITESPITKAYIQRLPFELTKGQIETYNSICMDMQSDYSMNRLVQGDVGSGKTIVALLSLMNAVYSGYQGVLMAPTEVLSKQHYDSINSSFKDNGIDIKTELLIGSMTAKEKRLAKERIENGEAQIVIGTHALIQEGVNYNNLGLVITDEQHRFGVNQRDALFNKGSRPHVLVMSATPIPRTLAIILYGDLDISLIKELPANRLPIKNCVVDHSYRPNAYKFITNEVNKGHQAYVICPMVEESETTEAENVVEYTSKLRQELPSNIRVEYLHGKMTGQQKQEIMEAFADNEIQVLVSTTVIEVGVNVPNATVMMIEDANRFGLAQLHQLRGRVGRGDSQSYCIFMASKLTDSNRERLDILNKSNDGFKIAEEDLKLRGPGEMFGVRQSGDFRFRIGDIYSDSQILMDAANQAKEVLNDDKDLLKPEHAIMREHIEKLTSKIKIS